MSNIEPMLLWVPIHAELSEEESNDLIQKVTLANDAVMDFAEGIITLDDTFQIIEHYGADVDNYQENLAETARLFGV